MKKQTHHIQKQHLILDFATEEKARHWHKTAATFYYSKMLPQLNSMLDKHVPEDRHYFIDSLEIDLGTVEEEALQQVFLKKIEAELIRRLKSVSSHSFSKVAETTTEEKARSGDKVSIKESKKHLIESFYYFLDHGILPWSSSLKSLTLLEAEIIQEIGLENLTTYPDFQKRLQRASIRRRLYFQFSPSFWAAVCHHLFKPVLSNLHSIQVDLAGILMLLAKNDAAKKRLRQELSGDVKVWIGNSAPAATQDWPQQYILWMVKKALPYVKPVGEAAVFNASMQELIRKNKEQHDTPVLATALKAAIAAAKTGQDTKIMQQQDRDIDKSNENKPVPAEGPKPDSTETDNTKRSSKDKSVSSEKPSLDKAQKLAKDRQTAKEPKTHPRHQAEKTSAETASKAPDDAQDSYLSKTEEAAASAGDATASPSELREQTGEQLPEHVSLNAAEEGTDSPRAGSLEDQQPENGPWTDDPPTSLLKSESEGDKPPDYLIELDVYYPTHAGIVLTWPYLARLFKQVGYLKENTFRDMQYRQRAIHLLAYMATGQEQCEEHALVMAKYLCAWPLQMPVIKKLELTNKEKTEADQMLSSLIKNWAVLKNTSLEGLRSSFFDRAGKLFKEEEQWRLLVEQKSYDMLLDHLPYTIGIIKLPWMKDVLKVDWA